MFSASQVYVPTSDNSTSVILRLLSIKNLFNTIVELLYFELLDRFIILPLKYHLIDGMGTPVVRHVNIAELVSFINKSFTSGMISGQTIS